MKADDNLERKARIESGFVKLMDNEGSAISSLMEKLHGNDFAKSKQGTNIKLSWMNQNLLLMVGRILGQ